MAKWVGEGTQQPFSCLASSASFYPLHHHTNMASSLGTAFPFTNHTPHSSKATPLPPPVPLPLPEKWDTAVGENAGGYRKGGAS